MLTYTDQQRCEKKVRANRLPHGGLVQCRVTQAYGKRLLVVAQLSAALAFELTLIEC